MQLPLTPEVQACAARSVLCWLATVDPTGRPNVSPKEIFAVVDARHLVIAHIASPGSVRNIEAHPAVCVSFIDIFVQKGFKLRGVARNLSHQHADFATWAAPLVAMAGPRFPIHSVLVVEVVEVEAIVAPSYRLYPAETTEASQVASAMRQYAVRPARSSHDELAARRLQPRYRPAGAEDAITISALSVEVFLSTYATEGVRPDLAAEVFSIYAADRFAARLAEASRWFLLAEHDSGLLGFAEVLLDAQTSPVEGVSGAELVRLYVQPQAQGLGIGKHLLQGAERAATERRLPQLWLTAWDGNHRAHAFYEALGYNDVGATTYAIQGQVYGNRVFAKSLGAAPAD